MPYYFIDHSYETQCKIAHRIVLKQGHSIMTACGMEVDIKDLISRLSNGLPDGVSECNKCLKVNIPDVLMIINVPKNDFVNFQGIASSSEIYKMILKNKDNPQAVEFLTNLLEKGGVL